MKSSNLDTHNDNSYSSNTSTREGLEGLLRTLANTDIFRVVAPGEGYGNKIQREIDTAIYGAKKAIADAPDKGWMWWEVFKAVYSGRVRLNAWTAELTFDGKPTTPEKLIDQLEDILEFRMALTDSQFERKYKVWVGEGYNPVKEELERLGEPHDTCSREWSDEAQECVKTYSTKQPTRLSNDEWSKLAHILFGVPADDNLSHEILAKWLVATIARVMEPGCQADNTLVLKGTQGIGKSSFFRVLAGDYYLGMSSSTDTLEVLRQLDRSWIVEMGEIEGITRKKEVTELKDFLTQSQDVFRGLYSRKPEVHKRHCVFGGSANSDEILKDDTGSRRFWVIDCGSHDINIDYLKANRNAILASAYYLYQSGFQWWMDKESTLASEERNMVYREVNNFLDIVSKLVAVLEKGIPEGVALKVSDLLTYGLGIPVERHKSNKNDKSVSLALKELGFIKKKITLESGRGEYYVRPDTLKPKSPSGFSIESCLTQVHHA